MSAARRVLGGEGPDLALIHGFGADRLSWSALVPTLARRATLQSIELPGHGDAGAVPADASPAGLAAVVAEVLEDLAGPVPLVAHSLGATVALELARLRPGRVSHLVLIAPALWGGPLDRTFLKGLPWVDTPKAAQALLERLVATPRFIPPGLGAHLLTTLDPARRAGWARIATALLQADPPAMPDLPVTVIWGARDSINPYAPASLPPGVTAHLVEEAGHLPQAEKAGAVARLISGALAQASNA